MSLFRRKPEPPPPHKCDWWARATQQISIYPDSAKVDEHGREVFPNGRYTHILYVCPGCGAAKSERVDGHWNLSDVRRDPKPPRAKGYESPWRGYYREGVETK